jgi:hypothetical protein
MVCPTGHLDTSRHFGRRPLVIPPLCLRALLVIAQIAYRTSRLTFRNVTRFWDSLRASGE